MSDKEAVLLNDEQVRQFIVDGYLELRPPVPDGIHGIICEKRLPGGKYRAYES